MAMLPTPFNAHQFEPAGPAVSQLPVSGSDGWPVVITNSEFKPSKSGGNNGYLELTLTIIEGEHKGATGPYRLNIFHENAQVVDIASRQLSALCHVCGQMMISDSSQLHNIPFRAVVGLQKKQKAEDPDYTEIKGVLDYAGQRPGKGNPAVAPTAAQNFAPQAPAFHQPQAPAPVAPPAPAAAPWGAPQAPAQPQQQFQPQAAAAPGAAVPPWAKQ